MDIHPHRHMKKPANQPKTLKKHTDTHEPKQQTHNPTPTRNNSTKTRPIHQKTPHKPKRNHPKSHQPNNKQGGTKLNPTTSFLLGYLTATLLGFLAALDALTRASKAEAKITTLKQAARWWFYRNPEK